MTWKVLAEGNPELAAFGAKRLNNKVAYLATAVQKISELPLIYPVIPIIGEGHLFVFMNSTSPQVKVLQQDSRYALHCSVGNLKDSQGAIVISGWAYLINDPKLRALAMGLANYVPAKANFLFEFDIEYARSTIYQEDRTIIRHWKQQIPRYERTIDKDHAGFIHRPMESSIHRLMESSIAQKKLE